MKTQWLCVALSAMAVAPAIAQAYPNRPVRVIVPWPPGQATDLSARLVALRLQEAFGQSFVIDNRSGAGGSIGTDLVAKATPDGHTLLAASSGPVSVMPNLQKTPYTPLTDFAPVSLIATVPFALVSGTAFPPANARELVSLVRANPDKFAFASSGTGATAHLFSELFHSMARIKARHVPYKGSAPALTDVINGQIHYTIETVASVVTYLKSGRLKAYGVTSAKRTRTLPDIPTLAEAADLPGFDATAWIGYLTPAGTPREIRARLAGEIHKAVQTTELRERYLGLGMEPVSNTPEEMMAHLRREQERYAGVIRSANIKIEN